MREGVLLSHAGGRPHVLGVAPAATPGAEDIADLGAAALSEMVVRSASVLDGKGDLRSRLAGAGEWKGRLATAVAWYAGRQRDPREKGAGQELSAQLNIFSLKLNM